MQPRRANPFLRVPRSAVLIQNARKASAALLPPLSFELPPSMSLPNAKKAVESLPVEN